MSDRAEGGASHERHSHERHEPRAWREPTKRDGQQHTSHAGNAPVNHGPDDKGTEKPDAVRSDDGLDGSDGSDGLDSLGGPGGPGSDEPALRRLLHAAVDDLEPRAGTLDHLRRAVPARRARKRQAVVGTAAAALFIGTAIPALVHVSGSGGSGPHTSMAGQTSQPHSGTGQDKDKDTAKGGPKNTASATGEPGKESGRPDEHSTKPGSGEGVTSDTDPSLSPPLRVPLCTAGRLGSATGSVNPPDTAGVVYGTFRVANTSGTACRVTGAGTITTTGQGAADPARVAAARHTAGDAAIALPDPSQEVTALVLKPGAAYEEKFAFVPSETCPPAGGDNGTDTPGTTDPPPDPTPTDSDSGTPAGGPDSEVAIPQLLATGSTTDGSVSVTHTAQGGAPTATAVVPEACAGTVYYTGMLAGA
jgi:hypothetical protein